MRVQSGERRSLHRSQVRCRPCPENNSDGVVYDKASLMNPEFLITIKLVSVVFK